jgi:hypothetical protein
MATYTARFTCVDKINFARRYWSALHHGTSTRSVELETTGRWPQQPSNADRRARSSAPHAGVIQEVVAVPTTSGRQAGRPHICLLTTAQAGLVPCWCLVA